LINYKIEQQNYEVIRNQIAAILTLELDRQVAVFYNTECEGISVYIERGAPVDKTETVFVNVSLPRGDFNNKHAGYTDGVYSFYVDVYTNAKATGDNSADTISSFRNQRVIGILRAILEDPQYKTFGFTPGNCANLGCSQMEYGEIKKGEMDATATIVGRLIVSAKAGEASQLLTGEPLLFSITQLKLGISNKGYKYTFGTDAAPVLDDRFVYIVDQYGNVLELLSGGQTYTVNRLQNIIDTITENEVNIIDNILPE
jgi:hypothetical protein